MKDKSKVLKMYGYYVRLIAIYKLRTSDGIFVILLMALSFKYCFFITSKLLMFRDIRKCSKPFLCDKLSLKL